MSPYFPALRRLVLAALLITGQSIFAQTNGSEPTKPAMQTPVEADNLDPAAFAEWVDGQEKPIVGAEKSRVPQWLLWTDKTQPGHSGLAFGESKTPGPRHLRLGLKSPVSVGSVIVRGGGQLSVLKAGATWPGDLSNEADWLPAQRLDNRGQVSGAGAGKNEFAVWTLPPGTETRALRFTHVAEASDAEYRGFLGGAFVMRERWANLAPLAAASASGNTREAPRINNGADDTSRPWDNIDNRQPASADQPAVSFRDQQWVMLTWPAPVKLGGLVTLGAGFRNVDADFYSGPAELHPRDLGYLDWWEGTHGYAGLSHGYPAQLWPNRLPMTEPVVTRAVRLRIKSSAEESHPHLKGDTKDGKRVWLGELMALQPLGDAPLQAVVFPAPADEPHPPVPVRFKLEKAGFVTLIIEDESGKRVRNLISETPFPAGDNVAWWDGTDDLGRDVDAAKHGLYHIPAQFVAPGNYRVRGLVRGEIEPRYEFSIYSGGFPAWETADKAGGWLTNHTPPQAALFVPADKSPTGAAMVYLGSAVSEGGAGLAWVDLEGKKIGGRGWIGGNWTAAPFLARDAGPNALPEAYAYVGATWTASADNKDKKSGELRITALTAKEDKPIIKWPFTAPPLAEDAEGDHHWVDQLGGLAVHNSLLAASMKKLDKVLFIDTREGKVTGEKTVENPHGLVFDAQGRLLVLSGKKLLRFDAPSRPDPGKALIATGLEDPRGITLDDKGHIYISDWGTSHQVKVFSPDGKFLRAIGQPGAPKAGPYDPLHMNHPAGLALDANGRLWVTENDYLPKRVSVWNADGTLWKAFYGPAKYGGGGMIDSQDKTRFYYADESRGAMEFKLDWAKGESQLVRVYYRPGPGDLPLPDRSAAPELALYHEGRRYFTNCYNSNPTGGSTAFLFVERDGLARPAAGIGRAGNWDFLKEEAFASRLPVKTNWKKNPPSFLWADGNDDAQVQPEEVTFLAEQTGGVTVMADLSLCVARLGDKAVRFAPTGFTKGGAPIYDFAKPQTLAEGVQGPASSGGDQLLAGSNGWTAVTLGITPFARHSLSGAKDGQPKWSYPSMWPGLHAAHEAPAPDRPGQLIGTTRLLGGLVTPKGGSDAGEIWAVNANMGTLYLFTTDGLFIATVFEDKRQGKSWAMPVPERNMSLKGFTLGEENFWPTWSQTPDGQVYVMNGAKASLVRLDGLETIRRLPDAALRLSAGDLEKAQAYRVVTEARRQQAQGRGVLTIALRGGHEKAPVVDGNLDDWAGAAWVEIDKSGVGANFNSNSKPYDITAAVAIAGDRLHAAFRTADAKLLQNSGEVPHAPFKTGGALDLMLGTNPAADPKRTAPVEGDLRLLITQAKGKPLAMLYRAVVPGTKEPVPFSSPWRTITLDRADDVSSQIELAGADGNYEISIPLASLGLQQAKDRQTLKGDIGILRGDGTQTTARVYWSNKSSGITSDVPSEAMLTPQLWGRMELQATPRR